jgi:hypothetical protein
MLLILAQVGDETADRLAAAARQAGRQCLRLSQWRDVEASVWAERDATVRVELRPPPRAVLNRGLPLNYGVSEAEDFRNAEIVSTWWSALAAFPGPVVNRPTLAGFLPHLVTMSLAAAVPGLLAPGCIGPPGCEIPAAPAVNVHRLRDAVYLGRYGPALELDEDELYLYTPFDPGRVVRLLLAGEQVFDLDQTSGRLDPGLAAHVQPLAAELRRRQATFSRVVLGWRGDDLHLLQASALPGAHHYRGLENQVHRALLEYLT